MENNEGTIGRISQDELDLIVVNDFWEDLAKLDDYTNCYKLHKKLYDNFFNDNTSIELVATLLEHEPYNEDGSPVINNIEPISAVFALCFRRRIICNDNHIHQFNILSQAFSIKVNNEMNELEVQDHKGGQAIFSYRMIMEEDDEDKIINLVL